MKHTLAQTIHDRIVEPGSLAIFWIAQAGFVFKTPGGIGEGHNWPDPTLIPRPLPPPENHRQGKG